MMYKNIGTCLLHCDVALLPTLFLVTDGPVDKLKWSCAELPIDGQKVVLVVSVLENPGQFYCYNYSTEGMVLPVCKCVLKSSVCVVCLISFLTCVFDRHADPGRVVHCSDEAL